MQIKHDIEQMISRYQLKFSEEMNELEPIIQFLKRTDEAEICNRQNFDGHLTASAFVLNVERDALLFLHHKKLNRWLQPGGHVDQTDADLLHAAIRETVEETGVTIQHLEPIILPDVGAIFDIDSHYIPANPRKQEPAHAHHDCRFLLTCNTPDQLDYNTDEALGIKWIKLEELLQDETFKKVAGKILASTGNATDISLADKLV